MAAATARRPTDLELRLIRSDPVFARLATVIGWIKPSVKGTSNQLSSIRLATERFAHCWDELLPDERERALDLVLACFCDLESGVEGWTMVLFKDLKVGAKRSRILHNHGWCAKERQQLALVVDEIVDEAQPADVDKASSFRASFLSPDGVTAAKLKRMENAEWKHCAEELETSLERIRAGTPAAQALPSVDLLLLRAHDVAQTPENRLAIFTHCVDNLLKLYQQRHLPHVTHEQHLDYLRSARETLLNEVEATSFVRHLPPDRQQAAVRLVRERLYSACRARMSGDGLPLLRGIVNELCTAVMVDIDPSTIKPPSHSTPPHPPHEHGERSLGISLRSAFFPVPRRSAW